MRDVWIWAIARLTAFPSTSIEFYWRTKEEGAQFVESAPPLVDWLWTMTIKESARTGCVLVLGACCAEPATSTLDTLLMTLRQQTD